MRARSLSRSLPPGTQGSTSAECKGQGIANVLSGLSGGMGGCALIGQSLINIDSGGTSRLSGVVMSAALALGIVVGAPLLAAVPIASLVGLMFVVCASTFSWSSLRLLGRIPKVRPRALRAPCARARRSRPRGCGKEARFPPPSSLPKVDVFVLVLVSVITVCKDLAVAVVAGTILSALAFAWTQSTQVAATTRAERRRGRGGAAATVYALEGQIFFGSARAFQELFAAALEDPAPEVVLDFAGARVLDHSGAEAIASVCARFGAAGRTVRLRRLSADCAALLDALHAPGDAARAYQIVEVDAAEDPVYKSAITQNSRTRLAVAARIKQRG